MRVFLAFEIGERQKNAIWDEVRRTLNPKGIKLVERENYHITVVFFGEKSPKEVEEMVALLKDDTFEPIAYEVKGVDFFTEPRGTVRVGYLQLAEEKPVKEIAEKFRKKLQPYFSDDKEFKAHITVFRTKRGCKIYKGTIMKREWNRKIQGKITKLTLFRSFLRREGPVYEPIFTIHAKEMRRSEE